ncbi:MAG: alkaline phosphatase [Flavobacteriaceae bacterium]
MFKNNSLLVSLLLVIFVSCKGDDTIKKNQFPKNIIFLISDGTGLSQISSAYFYKNESVNYSRFNDIGLIETYSSDNYITDSAASATAFATGEKTYNGAIGVSEDFKPVNNLIELASLKGVNTGLVSTSSITHATPASFFAHTISRDFEDEIAMQLAKSEVDYFAGGGMNFFENRKDNINVIDTLKSNGFSVKLDRLDSFDYIKSNNKQCFILAADGMPKISEGRGSFLKDATMLGVNFLSKKNKPFFMMSEGSQIDWGGHDNDANYLITELIDFDEMIGAVLDYAEKDRETLVIVTSDHETGGFSLSGKNFVNMDNELDQDYSEIEPTFSTGGHTATLIPVFAYGPGSEEFRGIYDNTDIFNKILKVTNWGN